MQQAVKEQKVVNGINVEEFAGAVDAVQQQPELAKFQFRAANKWENGTFSRASVNKIYGVGEEHERENQFVMDIDEPPVLMGKDRAPNPAEYALAALSGCLTTSLILAAAEEGIRLEKVESTYEGDIDVRGSLGVDETVRNGFKDIRVSFKVKGDAPEEKLRELVETAKSLSPIFDMVSNKTPVSVRFEN